MNYDVLHLDPIPVGPGTTLPDGGPRLFQPLAVTLITGTRDAVLVDPPATEADARIVADRIAASGQNLTHIAVTHGHGDHWFTADLLARRFGARVVATAGTIEQMRIAQSRRSVLWDAMFPGQLPDSPVTAEPVPGDRFLLEGHDVVLVPVGNSDCDDSSVVHVPDLDLVVAGDVLYNGAHIYLGDSALQGLDDWRRAIGHVAALRPRHIVASHGDRTRDHNGPRIIAETLDYLEVADQTRAASDSALAYFNAMIERFPDRAYGKTLLWVGAQAIWAQRSGLDRAMAAGTGWLQEADR